MSDPKTPDAQIAAWRFGWWLFRYGASLRLGHLLVSVGVYPGQKYPSDWRPVVVKWKGGRSWPR